MTSEVITTQKVMYPGDTIGIIGEGRAGAQLVLSAKSMGYKVVVYVTDEYNESLKYADKGFIGSLHDGERLQRFAAKAKIVLYESELVDLETIRYLQQFVAIPQGIDLLELSQDRIIEKVTFEEMGIKVPKYATITSLEDLYEAIDEIGYPAILKPILKEPLSEKGLIIQDAMDIPKANDILLRGAYILESWIYESKEISITVVKDRKNQQQMFPMVENVYQDHHLQSTSVPTSLTAVQENEVFNQATKIAKSIDYVGVFSIVFYASEDGILLKRIIPGMHRSQNIFNLATNSNVFEETLRAVCGMPINNIRLLSPMMMVDVNKEQMQQVRTQWVLKANWHFHFYTQITAEEDDSHFGYILVDGDNIEAIHSQVDTSEFLIREANN